MKLKTEPSLKKQETSINVSWIFRHSGHSWFFELSKVPMTLSTNPALAVLPAEEVIFSQCRFVKCRAIETQSATHLKGNVIRISAELWLFLSIYIETMLRIPGHLKL